jgi:hypothetical protein
MMVGQAFQPVRLDGTDTLGANLWDRLESLTYVINAKRFCVAANVRGGLWSERLKASLLLLLCRFLDPLDEPCDVVAGDEGETFVV